MQIHIFKFLLVFVTAAPTGYSVKYIVQVNAVFLPTVAVTANILQTIGLCHFCVVNRGAFIRRKFFVPFFLVIRYPYVLVGVFAIIVYCVVLRRCSPSASTAAPAISIVLAFFLAFARPF